MQRQLLASVSSILVIAVTFLVASVGYISFAVAMRFAVMVLVLIALFLVLIRSGLNQRFADPSMTMAQMAAAGLAISYVVFEGHETRPTFLFFYFIAFMFGVFLLDRWRLFLVAMLYLACYLAVVALALSLRPETIEPRREIFRVAIFAIMLAWFTYMGGYVSSLRRRLRRANDEVMKLNREQRRLFDTATVGIALIRDAKFADCNRWFADMLGYQPDELIGASVRICMTGDESWERANRLSVEALRKGKGFRDEITLQKKSGELIT